MPQHRSTQTRVARPKSSRRTPAAHRAASDFAVVGIGASAGGLEACRRLMDGMPAGNGIAFILVQHLDPTHESMMVDLLAGHTSMTVCQANEGMPLEPDHLYVIPPGTYLSMSDGALRLSLPKAPHGARLPFDFLLHSLAEEYGPRAVAVILSGTGADGTLGLKAIKENGGLVIAQDPGEAGFDGMPRNAIATGAVDLVLPVANIPNALVTYDRRMTLTRTQIGSRPKDGAPEWLPGIIELLHTTTGHDFRLYKSGTLQRRIERRMAMAAIETDGIERYLEALRSTPDELDLLASDLLINVTSFFRDRQVFDVLAERIIPDLVRRQPSDQPLRIWVAGCSTGEETYSLAMLFREAISAAKSNVKLQVFASDIDSDAVANAREGFYPEAIEAEVSPERLARFFTREEYGYRVLPELRASVVFTAQDVLTDPPFSRLDLVSCRNLLIYLAPEAQARVLSAFHFALHEGGILLLGSSETVDTSDGRFEVISKAGRIFRHVGRSRPGELGFSMSGGDGVRVPARPGQSAAASHQVALADLCRRLVLEAYAPAAVLINSKHECLFSLGPIDRYLRVAPGSPIFDLLAMVRPGIRNKLRSAIERAVQENLRIVVAGGRASDDGGAASFSVDVRPILNEGEQFLLIGFVDDVLKPKPGQRRQSASQDVPRIAKLEQELETARADLQAAIRELESSNEEQKLVNEEALSVNEEFQSTNEELLTSKEELQSLNEELTALNGQLQETLEKQRTTSNDLQNVLYSTDVATLFLDSDLNIRFFTPATRLLFNILPGDIGRPLADLSSQTSDGALSEDAGRVLRTSAPIDREIQAKTGAWYIRRILPYRTQLGGVEGVVVTFTDITERRRVRDALEAAEHQAQLATAAKSRFLAAASHDLRQPLQTLALLQGQLAKIVEGEKAQNLVARLDDTMNAMSGMLNALLDINQIEAGTIRSEVVRFPVNDLLARMQDEFTPNAQAQGLALRVVPCSLSIGSDPRLLEQMVRNLLSNALKYTSRGKVLLGCRRHGGSLAIEVSDTGDGIPAEELKAIFEEYHQLDNAARERKRGLGLGLSIVRRLADLLRHQVHVRSQVGKGSAFAIEVPLLPNEVAAPPEGDRPATVEKAIRTGAILVVEDDPEVRDLLDYLLKDEGHRVVTAPDGIAALDSVGRQIARPDLILADYNLPHGMNGLQVAAKLRERCGSQIPVIILTGDISTHTLREIGGQHCVRLNKPVKLRELTETIQTLLQSQSATPPAARAIAEAPGEPGSSTIFVVDDDDQLREAMRSLLEDDDRTVEDYPTCEAFLEAYRPGREGCLLIDAYLPGMSGIELLQRLPDVDNRLPAIMMTGNSDVPIAVQAMKAGAFDFIEKPIGSRQLLASIERALDHARDATKLSAWQEEAAEHIAKLTARQRQIMDLVLAGHPSKNIAADLGISQRTVENHRAEIMRRTGSKSLPALARLAVAATRQ